jgi:hypothetical protein
MSICASGLLETTQPLSLLRFSITAAATPQAVAANDVGRFVEFHPHGRYIVSDLRGKEMLMRLMNSTDMEVQKRALLAVQRIMLPKDKLDWLQAASSGA